MQRVMIHLEDEQKKAIGQLAARKGTNMSAEIRSAVDRYLDEAVDAQTLALLDAVSRDAEQIIAEMQGAVDGAIAKCDETLAEIERVRASARKGRRA